jgi:hypothetical protein
MQTRICAFHFFHRERWWTDSKSMLWRFSVCLAFGRFALRLMSEALRSRALDDPVFEAIYGAEPISDKTQ